MIRFSRVVCYSMTLVLFASAVPAEGHTVFKKALEKKFEGVRVSCDTCHVKGKPKTERNEFGQLFHEQFKEEELTAKWEAFGADRTGKKAFETEVMTPSFHKALEKVKQMKNKEEMTYEALIKECKLDGLKPKKPGKSTDDDDDDDDDDDGGK